MSHAIHQTAHRVNGVKFFMHLSDMMICGPNYKTETAELKFCSDKSTIGTVLLTVVGKSKVSFSIPVEFLYFFERFLVDYVISYININLLRHFKENNNSPER